jgi:hypothetical protein
MKHIKTEELFEKIRGVQTLKSVTKILGVKKKRAIYLISRLRKKGYVKTSQEKDNSRVYYISKKIERHSFSFIDILNENSPQKLNYYDDYIVHNIKPSLEEVLIYSLKSKDLRKLISCLGLFKKMSNWPLLYKLAKKENLQRQVGALYDVARTLMKTRKMTKRFKNLSLPKKQDKFQYIKENFKSKSFQNIEKKWKVYIPLNIFDLEEYRKF